MPTVDPLDELFAQDDHRGEQARRHGDDLTDDQRADRRHRRAVSGSATDKGIRKRKAKSGAYQARKVYRLVRHIEAWSVLKISLIFYFCLWVMMLVAGALLWRVADNTGMIGNVESFIEEVFALEEGSFAFQGGEIFRIYAIGGLVGIVAATALTVLLTLVFNLISDLTGGIRLSVVEEETARPASRR